MSKSWASIYFEKLNRFTCAAICDERMLTNIFFTLISIFFNGLLCHFTFKSPWRIKVPQ